MQDVVSSRLLLGHDPAVTRRLLTVDSMSALLVPQVCNNPTGNYTASYCSNAGGNGNACQGSGFFKTGPCCT